MDEYRIHYLASELVKAFSVKPKESEGLSVEEITTKFLKHRNPNVNYRASTSAAMKKIAKNVSEYEILAKSYEELKAKKISEFDGLVHLVSEISSDKLTKSFLRRHAEMAVERKQQHFTQCPEFHAKQIADKGNNNDMVVESRTESMEESGKCYRTNENSPGTMLLNMPCWTKAASLLAWDFLESPCSYNKENQHPGPIGALPVSAQEQCLIEDLLLCLGGISGSYITAEQLSDPEGPRMFRIDPTTDDCLKVMVNRILPICSHYSTVIRFIKDKMQFGQGLVNNALASALRLVIKDYYVLIAQLEQCSLEGKLTLQKMWFYLQPMLRTMQTLALLATTLNQGLCYGGTVLSVLHSRTLAVTGDEASQQLCLYLTQAASIPYFSILEKWIYKGVITDPHSEFLVEDTEPVKEELPLDCTDDYWEKRYTIRREMIPCFLESVSDMILRTGKYLNVIRQCGYDMKCPYAENIVYTITERRYVEQIESAYSFASNKLLALLMETSDLVGRLKSVKHYYLMDQGDFIVQFMDMAEDELNKEINEVMPSRLESLLELALRTSVVNSDIYKDDVRIDLLSDSLLHQMWKIQRLPLSSLEGDLPNSLTGIEALTFNYDVRWPLSLILNKKAITCYQMLFRHLLYCKHVERLLGEVWRMNKVAKSFSVDSSCGYASAFALRQRMLTFVQNLEYYITVEVIEPSFHIFLNKVNEVSNVDELLACHNDFLDSCLKDSMLTHSELLKTVVKLLKLCAEFSRFMQSSDACISICLEPTFDTRIQQYHEEFDDLLQALLIQISQKTDKTCSDKIVNLYYRLDFTGFYSSHMKRIKQRHSEAR